MWPPAFPASTKVATSLHPGAKTSLALISLGATASAWEKCCCFKINVIVCHRKPIWLLFLLSCAHLTPHTGLYLRMWFSFSLPSEGGNGHLAFSSLLSHTLGKVKMGLVYTKYLAHLWKTICLSTSNNRLSFPAAAAAAASPRRLLW